MVVAIIAGRGGTGKTSQLITLARLFPPTRWAIMEKKDERALKTVEEVKAQLIYAVDKEYNTDPMKILNMFGEWRDSILQSKDDKKNTEDFPEWKRDEIKCIVVDGISDLRNYAMEEWLQTHPIYDQKTGEERKRKTISGENIGAWGEINKRVRLLVEPLINYSLYHNVHLFLTAQMKDTYVKNTRVGQEPDIKDWLEYPCECLLVLKKDKNTDHYECSCEKAPIWSGESGWIEEMHKDTGLLEVLSTYKLI